MFKLHVIPFVHSGDCVLCTSNPVQKVLAHTDSLNCKFYVLEVIGLHIFNEGFWLILVLFLWRMKDVDLGSSSWNSASTICWGGWVLSSGFLDAFIQNLVTKGMWVYFWFLSFFFIFTPLILPIQEHERYIFQFLFFLLVS